MVELGLVVWGGGEGGETIQPAAVAERWPVAARASAATSGGKPMSSSSSIFPPASLALFFHIGAI